MIISAKPAFKVNHQLLIGSDCHKNKFEKSGTQKTRILFEIEEIKSIKQTHDIPKPKCFPIMNKLI